MDAASFICLAMAIGLSVDYVVHLSHAVASEEEEESGSENPRSTAECIAKALDKVGVSIFKGGLSTFLGICLLAFSLSEVRTI